MWRARPIFISSTFEDFQAERDHLRNHVFPELEERLRQKRRHLEWVDLRVGVPIHATASPQERELDILKVCLAEVERCRPFLLVLLGDRYGWIPDVGRVRAAAQEAALKLDNPACSITELEIVAGAFAKQGARVLVYMREPLDYRRMPKEVAALYSSQAKGDSNGEKRLRDLKERIRRKFKSQVRTYRATWDESLQRTSGLEDWGRQVVRDLWTELAADAGDDLAIPRSPHELERDAIEEFVEDRARDFIGREQLVSELARLALDRSTSLGVCVGGEAGAGKSAVFAALARKLAGMPARVLRHAAGAAPGSGSVNAMLRRWIEELGADAPGDVASDAQIEATFAQALQAASQKQRVVVLIDALDQFEATRRAQQLAWAPQQWPSNVRLMLTGTSSEAMRAAAALPGMAQMQLTPLGLDDARKLIKAISARYHRALEPSVVAALADKGAGNPLWLVLAAEEINLVDADDLARAKRNYSGDAAGRLRAMMLDLARALPGDIPGLYGAAFKHAEEVFGRPHVDGFLAMIGVSRGGWRESDFAAIMPVLSAQTWDPLRFASIRRLFRGQMRQRGLMQQWDFTHAQMRVAALGRMDETVRARVHAVIATHLLTLLRDDPLRISETMTHLIGCEDWDRAASILSDFGHKENSEAGVRAACETMIAAVLATPDAEWARSLPVVARVMQVKNERDRYRATQRFQYEVVDSIANRDALPLERRLKLHQVVRDSFLSFGNPPEGDIRWYSHVAAAGARIAEDLIKMGDLAAAEPLLRESVRVDKKLTELDPDYPEWNRDLSVAYNKLGEFLRDRGDHHGAIEAFRAGMQQIEYALRRDPQPQWQRDLAISQRHLAELERRIGSPEAARAAAAKASEITERLARAAPGDVASQVDRARDCEDRGDRLILEGAIVEAEQVYRNALSILENVVRVDPGDGRSRRSLARAWRKLGELLKAKGALGDADKALEAATTHAVQLMNTDPSNADWASDAASMRIGWAEVLASLKRPKEAQKQLLAAEGTIDRLLKEHPRNPNWLEYRGQSQRCAGRIHEVREDLDAAERSYRAAVETRRERAKIEPGRVAGAALAAALSQLGDFLLLRRKLADCERAFAEAGTIMEQMARDDPRDVNAVQAAASILGRRGEIKGLQRAHREALALFEQARVALEKAVAVAPQFPSLHRNLAANTFNVGHAYGMLGDARTAAEWQRRAIALFEPHARTEAEHAQIASWRSQLFETENRLSNVNDPRAQEARCAERISALESQYGTAPQDSVARNELHGLYTALRAIQARNGDLDGAQRSYQAIRRLEQS